MNFELPDYETLLFFNYYQRPKLFSSNISPMIEKIMTEYNFTFNKVMEDFEHEISEKNIEIEQKRKTYIESARNTIKNWQKHEITESSLDSICHWEMEIKETEKEDCLFNFVIYPKNTREIEKFYRLSKTSLTEIKEIISNLKNVCTKKDFTTKDFTKNGWFIVGLNFADGTIFKLLNRKMDYTEIAKKIYPKNPNKIRSHISSSAESLKNKNDLFFNLNKIDKIIEYCEENDIEICPDFHLYCSKK